MKYKTGIFIVADQKNAKLKSELEQLQYELSKDNIEDPIR